MRIKRQILATLFSLTFVGLSLLPGHLFAQTREQSCCLIKEDKIATGCRLELNQPCDTSERKIGELQCIHTVTRVVVGEGPCNSGHPDYGLDQKTVTEQEVVCLSKEKCRELVTKEKRCDLLTIDSSCRNTLDCFWLPAENLCLGRFDRTICDKIATKSLCGTIPGTSATVCQWNQQTDRCISAVENELGGRYTDFKGALPTCAYQGNCRSINDFLITGISFVQYFFAFIGSFAFLMFVYGGITMILSMGNSEKVKKGRDILTAAVIGLFISFGAYLLVRFILEALQVTTNFRGV